MPIEAHESALTAMQTTLVAMQVQQGRIETTLNIVVTQHERRIEENSRETKQLRTDLDAVRDNADKKINILAEKSNKAFEDGREKGNIVLRELDNRITTNTNNISETREDVKNIWERLNGSTGKAVLIISPLIAAAALLWNIIGSKV
jgi:ElaB/YqjD/DUF883 family membrane-anchored ribosome-binding protein